MEKKIKINKRFLQDPKLICNSRFREILGALKTQGESPNPDLYQHCEIQIEEAPNPYLEDLASRIKPLKPTLGSVPEDKSPLIGPLYSTEYEAIYICQFNSKKEPEGEALIIFQDQTFYEGHITPGGLGPEGRLTFADGDFYIGDLENNSMSGQGAYYKGKSGSVYKGGFLDDAPFGKGREDWEDGSVFIGNYSKGSKCGYGEFTFANGTCYKGQYAEDVFHGEGVLNCNGTLYKGTYVKGQLASPATISSNNGNHVYEGEIFKMKSNGHGILNDRGRLFEGEFQNGKMNGEFEVTNFDGSKQTALYEAGMFLNWVGAPVVLGSKEEI